MREISDMRSEVVRDLLDRLTAADKEIDRLKKLAANMEAGFHEAIAEKDAEIERLRNNVQKWIDDFNRETDDFTLSYDEDVSLSSSIASLQRILRGEG